MKARVLMIGLTMATALLAQSPGGGFRRNQNATPPTPQQIIQRQVDRLTRFLVLSTDQQSQISGILSADINNLQSLQSSRKAQRGAVLDAIKTNSGVPTAVAALSAIQSQIETIRANEAALIYAALTADQKTKVGNAVAMLSGGNGPGHGPGGRRGFGPPH